MKQSERKKEENIASADEEKEEEEGLGWTMSCYWQITTQLAYLLLLVIRMNNEKNFCQFEEAL